MTLKVIMYLLCIVDFGKKVRNKNEEERGFESQRAQRGKKKRWSMKETNIGQMISSRE